MLFYQIFRIAPFQFPHVTDKECERVAVKRTMDARNAGQNNGDGRANCLDPTQAKAKKEGVGFERESKSGHGRLSNSRRCRSK